MRIIHNGYAITTYGMTCVSISDPTGKEIYHATDKIILDEKDARNFLKKYLRGELNNEPVQ